MGMSIGSITARVVIDQATAKRDLSAFEKNANKLDNKVIAPKVNTAPIASAGKQVDAVGVKMDKVRAKTEETANSFSKLVIPAAVIASATAFAAKAVKEYTRLENSLDTAGNAFGENKASMEAWAETAGKVYRRSKTDILDYANSMKVLFMNTELSNQQQTDMSKNLVKLGVELGSLFNVDTGEALGAFRSALAGSMEPLQRFGIVLRENNIKSEAFQAGLWKEGEQLTSTARSVATYNAISKQLNKNISIAARSGYQTDEVFRRLGAATTNLSTSIGKILVPAIKPVINLFSDLIEKMDEVIQKYPDASKIMAIGGGAVGGAYAGGKAISFLSSALSTGLGFLGAKGVTTGVSYAGAVKERVRPIMEERLAKLGIINRKIPNMAGLTYESKEYAKRAIIESEKKALALPKIISSIKVASEIAAKTISMVVMKIAAFGLAVYGVGRAVQATVKYFGDIKEMVTSFANKVYDVVDSFTSISLLSDSFADLGSSVVDLMSILKKYTVDPVIDPIGTGERIGSAWGNAFFGDDEYFNKGTGKIEKLGFFDRMTKGFVLEELAQKSAKTSSENQDKLDQQKIIQEQLMEKVDPIRVQKKSITDDLKVGSTLTGEDRDTWVTAQASGIMQKEEKDQLKLIQSLEDEKQKLLKSEDPVAKEQLKTLDEIIAKTKELGEEKRKQRKEELVMSIMPGRKEAKEYADNLAMISEMPILEREAYNKSVVDKTANMSIQEMNQFERELSAKRSNLMAMVGTQEEMTARDAQVRNIDMVLADAKAKNRSTAVAQYTPWTGEINDMVTNLRSIGDVSAGERDAISASWADKYAGMDDMGKRGTTSALLAKRAEMMAGVGNDAIIAQIDAILAQVQKNLDKEYTKSVKPIISDFSKIEAEIQYKPLTSIPDMVEYGNKINDVIRQIDDQYQGLDDVDKEAYLTKYEQSDNKALKQYANMVRSGGDITTILDNQEIWANKVTSLYDIMGRNADDLSSLSEDVYADLAQQEQDRYQRQVTIGTADVRNAQSAGESTYISRLLGSITDNITKPQMSPEERQKQLQLEKQERLVYLTEQSNILQRELVTLMAQNKGLVFA